MCDDKELIRLFKANKSEIPDNGFSKELMNLLPKRNSVLPLLIITLCTVIGVILTVLIVDFTLLSAQINEMMISISKLQWPLSFSIASCFSWVIIAGTMAFALTRMDME